MSSKKQDIPTVSLPLISLNHISFLCMSVDDSVKFYRDVLGFELIKRPSSLNFEGAWLHKYGISIHLLLIHDDGIVDTNYKISFECENIDMVRKKLEDADMEYVNAILKDDGIVVDQIFFQDPDGNTIEICDCQKLPVIPLCHTNMTPTKQKNPM